MISSSELFSTLLEGKPNSLGRVIEVYDSVTSGRTSVIDLYNLYQFEDVSVSMRVSNILKRLWRDDPTNILPLIDLFIEDANKLSNPTFRWTIAQIVTELHDLMDIKQLKAMSLIIFDNLTISQDWILLTQSLKSCQFIINNQIGTPDISIIEALTKDSRNAISSQALKVIKLLKKVEFKR